ncbi:MAG: hypothetical protein RIS24_2310 [Verrucomicrobiota bacterium]|jgi:serine/threonine protein kinase
MAFRRYRPLLGSASVAIAVILLIGWWSLNAVQRTVEGRLRSELGTVIEANVTALSVWIQGQMRTASLLAVDSSIRDPAQAVLERYRTNPPTGFGTDNRMGKPQPPEPDPGMGSLIRTLNERLLLTGYPGAVLVSPQGRVVAAFGQLRVRPGSAVPADHLELYHRVLTNGRPALVTPFKPGRLGGRRIGGPLGTRRPNEAKVTNGIPAATANPNGWSRTNRSPGRVMDRGLDRRLGPAPELPPRGDLQVMQILVPVRNAASEIQGILAVVLRPEDEFTRVLSVARPGLSGETFAFDHEGRLLSQSRFDDQLRQLGLLTNAPGSSSALNLVLRDPGGDLTHGFQWSQSDRTNASLMGLVGKALTESNGVQVVPERDYRGVPVVGAWHWIDEHQFGVVTKIDAAEAFQPLGVLRWIFRILILLILLVTVSGIVAVHISTTWRRRFNEEQLRARQLGQYTLLAKIGEGAMGSVYRARHALLRRETAVKLLLPDRADDDLIRQFEREVQLTCRLTHPNTIQVFDYGHTSDGIFYYAMELLEGLTLQDLVDQHGPLPEARAVHLLRQVAESLQEAHGIGLIHRDIKPGNLFLCERGGLPDTLKVLDFGLVRDAFTSPGRPNAQVKGASPSSRFLGTPLYMAPETIREPGHGDVASDIYALSAVAYVLVTGRPLFPASSVEAVWKHHLETPAPSPRHTGAPDLSDTLEQLILDGLSKDPSRRPADMGVFLERLAQSSAAGEWTPERRRAWWHEFHAIPTSGLQRVSRRTEATIRIDLSLRAEPGTIPDASSGPEHVPQAPTR